MAYRRPGSSDLLGVPLAALIASAEIAACSSKIERASIPTARDNEVPLLPPATESEVHDAFDAIGHRASRDVIELYTQLGGFEDYTCDELWSLWSPSRIRQGNNVGGSFCWFADWLIREYLVRDKG